MGWTDAFPLGGFLCLAGLVSYLISLEDVSGKGENVAVGIGGFCPCVQEIPPGMNILSDETGPCLEALKK